MDQAKLHETEARCTQEAMPRCRARCPFRMDVRAFMEAMTDGRLRQARKLLERHLPLPEIMARICDHPCEDRCLRRDLGGSLAIGALEAVCVNGAERQTVWLPRAPRAASVAVLGNALAGLVVAFELSKKAYPVTIFHTGEPHGLLTRRFPALSEALVIAECEALIKAGCVFIQRPPDAMGSALLEEAKAAHAAVFVDADAASEAFAALGTRPDVLTCLAGENICAGGLPEHTPTGEPYASPSRQAGEGKRAPVTLERLVTHVSLTAGREADITTQTPLFTPLDKIAVQEAVLPQKETYTPEEAAREAARCIRCECLTCARECVYLQKYGSYPKSYTRQIYNNASIVKGEHRANSLINGCMLCGQCAELCPERFSMAELCLHARRDMVTRGYMPPSAHEFALEDMANANASSLFMGDPDGKKTAWVFFPGCQLAASRGAQVLAAYTFLRGMVLPAVKRQPQSEVSPEGGVGLFLACCGVPARWAGRETLFQDGLQTLKEEWGKLGSPTLVVACASCLKTFREAAPDIPCTSLWELLNTHFAAIPPEGEPEQRRPNSPALNNEHLENAEVFRLARRKPFLKGGLDSSVPPPFKKGAVTPPNGKPQRFIHDPCAARHDAGWQKAVRDLAARCGVALTEPERTGQETPCCGYGGLVWSAQPELADAAAERRVNDLGGPSLTSCIMCRDRFVENGGDSLHLFDILPFSRIEGLAAAPPPGLSARRANRSTLREKVKGMFLDETPAPEPEYTVEIPPPVLAELERKHILRDDVEGAVQAVEAAKARFLERGSGQYLGSWRPRNVTFWVRYSVLKGEGKNAYLLHDAWSHRMIVPGAGGETP